MSFAVEMLGITKRFGGFTALDRVSISVPNGEIFAIVGENGAGKTTLMRVLFGLYGADEGEIRLDGKPVTIRTAEEASRHGIGMVSQHYAIIPELTCLQNLMVGAEGSAWLDLRAAEARAQSLAEKMGFSFEWHRLAEGLGPAQSQKLEILKLLWREAEIMILDEPTAMLSPADADALFVNLNRLVAEGKTILLVTHRLPEVLQHCRQVTVLRGGQQIGTRTVSEITASDLAEMIVGKAVSVPNTAGRTVGEPVLTVENLTVKGDRGDDALTNVSFTVRQGEVLGIAGVDGNGQRELFQSLMGLRPVGWGRMLCEGSEVTDKQTAERIACGFRLIAEDRLHEAVIESWPLIENGVLGFQGLPQFQKGREINRVKAEESALAFADRFNTKRASLTQAIGRLSGGNQQRFVVARALAEDPKVVLAFQPTRGLDIEATQQVYAGIRETCDAGAAALVVSFDLDELLEQCDRILVLYCGKLFEPSVRSREVIGGLMVGHE